MRNAIFIILGCLQITGIVGLASAQELTGPDKAAYLNSLAELEKRSPGLTVDFREVRESRMLAQPMVTEGKLWFMAPSKFRREAGGSRPSTAVSDGKELWIYYPRFQEAERYQLGQQTALDDALSAITSGLNFAGIEDRFRVNVVREGTQHRLELTPRASSLKKVLKTLVMTLNEDQFVTRTDMIVPKGDRIVTDFSNSKRGIVPASRFEFKAPSGTKISEPLGAR